MGIGKLEWGNPRFTTLVNNGPADNRLDVAILSDGYSADEMTMFAEDAATVVQAFHDIEPMRTYIRHFNFHRVDVISQQSGCSDRWAKPPVKVNSALGAYFSRLSERRLVGWDWRVKQVAMRSGVPHDALLVIVNTPRRGGATRFSMKVGYASRNSSDFPRIMIHESGHCIAKLMDEYDYTLPALPLLQGRTLGNILPFANVDTNGKNPKWSEWIPPGTKLPTPLTDKMTQENIGAFEGASYVKYGAYKPTPDCMMRRHSQPFCPICQEQWIKRIYMHTRPVDRWLPLPGVTGKVGQEIAFSALLVRPNPANQRTVWRIQTPQGTWETRQVTDDYAHLTTSFPVRGSWRVMCTIDDRSPKLRKSDVIKQSEQSNTWRVDIA
jgi:hypothetical protein